MGKNAEIARRWYREVWIDRRDATIDELLADDFTGFIEGNTQPIAAADFKSMRRDMLAAFPDLKLIVEDVIEDGDKVAVRWRAEGMHGGPLGNIAATQQQISIRGMTWAELKNGKFVRAWDSWNQGGLVAMLMSAPAAG